MLSRSDQIILAARYIVAGWFAAVAWYWLATPFGWSWGYAAIDFALAVVFWRMSKRRWFPVPLFFLHAFELVYFLLATISEIEFWWLMLISNRIFELSVIYVWVCAVVRIALRRRRSLARHRRVTAACNDE